MSQAQLAGLICAAARGLADTTYLQEQSKCPFLLPFYWLYAAESTYALQACQVDIQQMSMPVQLFTIRLARTAQLHVSSTAIPLSSVQHDT